MNAEPQAVEHPKKTYTTPRLIIYGHVRSLTQSGTGQLEKGVQTQPHKRPASDRMLKENIVAIGIHPLGIGVYLFDYKPEYRDQWGHGRQFGVMAQEVEGVMPEAVFVHTDGYKIVDYTMLGISHRIQ